MNIEQQPNSEGISSSPSKLSPPPAYEAPVNNVFSSIRNTVGSAANNVSQTISSGKDAIVKTHKSYGYMVFIGIFVAIVLFMIAYGLYVYITNIITQKIVFEFPDSIRPMKGTNVSRLDGAKVPPNVNGNRNTFMFWIYINDINMLSGNDVRHIMHIGDETTIGSSPAVYLDGMKNRMYVRFSKKAGSNGVFSLPSDLKTRVRDIKAYVHEPPATAPPPTTTQSTDEELIKKLGYVSAAAKIDNEYDAIKVDLATRGVVIDYVPLQRWVHVAVVVNETVNRGYISTYLDGEIVSHVTSNDVVELSNGNTIDVDFTGLNLDKTGDLYVGGDIYNSNIPRGFSGLVSRVSIANFDMNGLEIKKVFYKGPVDGIMNKMGIPYGVRSPIYKID